MREINRGTPLNQQVAERLRLAIISGELVPNSLHSATSLGDLFGVSRTPVREAAYELARLGLVSIEPNRGIRILETSIDTLLEVFELRLMIEIPLARRAALNAKTQSTGRVTAAYEAFREAASTLNAEATLRADRDFHTALIELAGNVRAAEALEEQRNLVLQTGVGTVPTSRSCRECFEDHQDVYETVVAGDADGAAIAMHRHILNTATLLIQQETARRPEFGTIDAEARLGWIHP